MSGGDLADAEKILLDSAYAAVYRGGFILSGDTLAARLEGAVTAAAEERCLSLKSWAKGEVRLLLSVLSVQSDLENGLLFLRSLASGRTEYVPWLPGCGNLTGDFWRRLASARGDRALIEELCRLEPSAQSNALCGALAVLGETGKIWDAEWFYMKNVFAAARGVLELCGGARAVFEHLAYTIDLWNLRIWLGLHYGASGGGDVHFLEGGSLPREDLLFAKSRKALLRGSFWQTREDGNSPGVPEMSLLALERKFLLWQLGLRRQDPLGVQVMISYLARLFCEWRNLMTIFEGLGSGLDRAALQSVLLIGR